MKKIPASELNLLRQKAEEFLQNSPGENEALPSEADALKLIHELKVHQIELEMMYDELLSAKKHDADAAADKYAQLFELAPTGYFTLNHLGEITHLNPGGAAMLGINRSLLKKSRFNSFVSNDTKPLFDLFLDKVFKSFVNESCEITLTRADNFQIHLVLNAIATGNEECLITAIDITERRKSEVTLKESERFLKETQAIARLGSYTIDFKDCKWSGSEMLYAILGVEPDFINSFEGWVSIIHPDWQQVMRDYFNKEVLAERNKFDKEYKIIRPGDKQERWVHGIGQLEFNDENQPVRLIGIINDITERKLAEEKNLVTHSRLRQFIDSDIVGVVIADTSGKVIETNDYYLNLIGYSRKEFVEGKVDWRAITPAEWLTSDENAIREIRETGKCTPYEKEYLRRDGSRRFVLITDALLPGPELHIAGFIIDITERKKAEIALRESEIKYKELIENSPDAIAIYVDGKVEFANKECLRLMGIDNAEEIIGTSVLQFVHPDSRELVVGRMRQASGIGINLPLMEEKFIRPDGTDVLVEVKAMSLMFENKQAVQLIIRDITQRKLAEKKLNESQERLTKSQEMGHLGSWELDFETEQLIWSDEVYRILGLKPQEFDPTYEAFLESVHPDDRDMLNRAYFSSIEEGSNGYELEHRIIQRHTGEVHFVYEKCEHYRDDSGRIIRSVGMVHDITENKRAEAALRASESLYRAILEASPDAIMVADLDGKYLMLSPAAVAMAGYNSEKDLIGRSFTEFLASEDRDIAVTHKSLMLKSIKSGPNQYIGVRADGSHINVEVNGAIIRDANGQPANLLFIIRNITERKHVEAELKASEAKFRELFEANTDGITIFSLASEGPPSKIIDLNENAAKMVGYTREEMLQFLPNEMEKDITKEKMDRRRQDLLSKGVSSFETKIKHKDGHEIDVEIKVMLVNYNNQPALMNIVRDITDRKNSEIQLQKYAIELSKQIAEKDKFFSIIAHDLRGPFNGFLELTELMAEGSSKMSMEDMKKMAGVMKKSATNLFRLLGNLLEWSRMQRGITTYSPKPIFLNSKILEITGLAQEAASKKGLEIIYNIPDDILVLADENMLEGIIRNLVANAVKYTTTGGSVTISAKYLPGDVVEFSVKDTGIGMSESMIKNLFNIDINTNRKGTSGELSTGLGLIICKDFIEKHNGTLRIQSEVGKGSTFLFTIPGCKEENNLTAVNWPISSQTPDPGRKLRILIAEDEETSDLLISIALSKISLESYHAKTGFEAIDFCRAYPDIDLIMMDIQMPDMDGYEATRQIRKFNSDVIIIAQTAYTFSNDREKSIEAGCNDYISKPVSQLELLEIIKKHIK